MTKKNSRDALLDATFDEVYRYGYSGASISTILNKAGVPKGSMYHHFGSKKEMVLAMIQERLIPQVEDFFDFKIRKGMTAMEIIDHTLTKIAANTTLLHYGCPLHRLMFEMQSQDSDIANACEKAFERLREQLAKLLSYGMREGSIKSADPDQIASYLIASSWGFLSRPIAQSTPDQFLKDTRFLLETIKA